MKTIAFFRFLPGRIGFFGRSESGMTLPLMAGAILTLVTFVGIAIDLGRAQLVQSRLQFSLDAATLAAGTLVAGDPVAEANKYLAVNFNGYLGATLVPQDGSGDVVAQTSNSNASTTVIGLTASATVPTTFMQVLGPSSVIVSANSTISRQIAGLEVTLIIDVSYGDSLSEFVNGLQGFITDLFTSAPGVSGNLYVSIVPFNQTVNIGTQNVGWTTAPTNSSYATTQWGGGSWGGCVDARSGNGTDMNGNSAPEALLDDTPTTASFVQNYYPSDTAATIASKMAISSTVANADFSHYSGGTGCSGGSGYLNSSEGNNCLGWNGLNNLQQTDSQQGSTWKNELGLNIWQGVVNVGSSNQQYYTTPLNTANQGPNFMCPSPIVPLTNSATAAMAAIDSIQWVQGDWLPDQGLEWGWNTLSPKWTGLWGSMTDSQGNALPHPYNTTGWNKVIVWVEGTSTAQGPWTSYNIIDNNIRGAYGYLSDNKLGTTSMSSADTIIENRVYNSSGTPNVCTYLKQKGILIYTLGYSPDGTVDGLPSFMSGCATGSNYIYWFSNSDWSAFDTALNSIANSLTKLWLSE
jgi:hypothetical protein